MNIGEFSRSAGVSRSKVRFCEAEGLLFNVARQENGYRNYGADDLERVLRVKRAQALGFSLEQIGRFLALSEQDRKAKLGLVEAAEAKLAAIDRLLADVKQQRKLMGAFLAEVREANEGPSNLEAAQ